MLDLSADPRELAAALIDIPSVSLQEQKLADLVESALRSQATGFEVARNGNAVLARTNLGLPTRVLLAGHLDTVPIADNVPSHRESDQLYGCGSVDMKSGDAIFLHICATLERPLHDVTLVLYDAEEIAAKYNGLGRIEQEMPQWLKADFAILGEPTGAVIEAGCQGSLRVTLSAKGTRAHSGRAWLGENAIHGLSEVLTRLAAYQPRQVSLDGCTYREGLSAVRIAGGISGNVIPDHAEVDINYRFAPDLTEDQALQHVQELFVDMPVHIAVDDSARPASPNLDHPMAACLIELIEQQLKQAESTESVRAKYGWTDVARFAARGIAAVNYGPGDPGLAHTRDEHVPLTHITQVHQVLRALLMGAK